MEQKIVLLLIFAISISYRECFEYLYDITNNDFYLILGRQMVSQLGLFLFRDCHSNVFDKFQRNIKILLPCALLIYLFKSEFIVFEYLSPFAFAIIIIGIAYNFRYLNFIGKYSNVASICSIFLSYKQFYIITYTNTAFRWHLRSLYF